jgi:hypothetical protein
VKEWKAAAARILKLEYLLVLSCEAGGLGRGPLYVGEKDWFNKLLRDLGKVMSKKS